MKGVQKCVCGVPVGGANTAVFHVKHWASEGSSFMSSSTSHEAPLPEVEREPKVAAALFGERIDLARQFTADLAKYGEMLGLVGPSEYPRLWTRHIVNSALVAPLLQESVADVGSGAGLPGIPLAIARPDVQFTFIEPMERRVKWLHDECERLQLDNVRIVRGRAEDVKDDVTVRQATARAVAGLSKLIPLVAPLVVAGGELLLMKGRSAEEEIEKARKVMRKYRVSEPEILELGADYDTEQTRVVRAIVDADFHKV